MLCFRLTNDRSDWKETRYVYVSSWLYEVVVDFKNNIFTKDL